MQIRSYNDNPQGFLDDLGRVNLDQLTGSHSSELDPLLRFIREKGIQISASGSSPFINEELLKKMLAYFMPEDAIVKGGHLDRQIRGGIEHLKELLTSAVAGNPAANPPVPPKPTWSLQEFMTLAHFSLTGDRVDDDIIGVMAGTMTSHEKERNKLKDEISALTAELKIYSVIQARVNSNLSAGHGAGFSVTGGPADHLDLMNYSLYGYSDFDKFKKSPEYAVLLKANPSYSAGIYTVKTFLESGNKSSGSLALHKDKYTHGKDDTTLSNFATTLSDKSRPINDSVSEKTTKLNDISSRYNSAIEALNKFIQKYESMMQQILQSI